MTAPHRVDNVTLTDATDFAKLAHDALDGGVFGSTRDDNYPVDAVMRAYGELQGTPYADRLSRGVAECLTAPEPLVRAQAMVFFQNHPRAAGAERVADLVAGNRAPFAGVPDPIHSGVDLDWSLLGLLAARVSNGDGRALDLARAEALRPGKAEPLIGALTNRDPDWVQAHVDEIVSRSPGAGITILIKLQKKVRDLVPLGRRVAQLSRADRRFEDYVTRFIDDPRVRQAILDAFRAPSN